MGKSIEERVALQEQKIEKMLQKLSQQKQVLKQMKSRKDDSERRHRTHMLIQMSAEISSIYGIKCPTEEDIAEIVKFLRYSKDSGVFNYETKGNSKQIQKENIEEKTQEEIDLEVFGNDFLF